MTGFVFTETPPDGWDRRCADTGAFFSSPAWQDVLLDGFSTTALYGWDGAGGGAISLFPAGPFRIGYLGFPVGTLLEANESPVEFVQSLAALEPPARPVCLRIPVSPFAGTADLGLPWTTAPETAIPDLQNWRLDDVSKNLRRDIRRAQRSGLELVAATLPAQGDALFDMYCKTVERKGGSQRYTRAYFRSLVKLSLHDDRIDVLLAQSGGNIAGFAVTARERTTTYYLHGGANEAYRADSPSDLLLSHAIETARARGFRCFNLMASPATQVGLVRYKEKWGGETRAHRTYTLPLRATYPLFRAAELAYRLFS